MSTYTVPIGANDMNTERIPNKLVVLTFDDALNNHATVVAARLKEYGFTSKEALIVLKDRGFLWARTGGGIPYNPLIHHPLLIPSFEAPLQKDLHSFEKMVNQAKNGAITVLLFHGVPDLAHPWVSMDQETFEVYMEYLYKNDFTVISMRGLGKYIDPIKAYEMIESRS